MSPSLSRLVLFFTFCASLFSCRPSALSEEELRAYLLDESNGLTQSIKRNGVNISVNYRPTDLLVAQELSGIVNDSLISLKRTKYKPYLYFILNYSKNGKEVLSQSGSFAGFSENLQNLSFRMGEYVNLTTSQKDTIPLLDSVFPRLYGMGKSTSVMLVFNKEKALSADWVQLNLKDIGMGLGKSTFRFELESFESVPQLIFEK